MRASIIISVTYGRLCTGRAISARNAVHLPPRPCLASSSNRGTPHDGSQSFPNPLHVHVYDSLSFPDTIGPLPAIPAIPLRPPRQGSSASRSYHIPCAARSLSQTTHRSPCFRSQPGGTGRTVKPESTTTWHRIIVGKARHRGDRRSPSTTVL
jgi:hypothetical protein